MEFEALEFIVTKLDEIMCDEEAEYTYIGYAKKEEADMNILGIDRQVEVKLKEQLPSLVKELCEARCLDRYFPSLNRIREKDYIDNVEAVNEQVKKAIPEAIKMQPYHMTFGRSSRDGISFHMFYDSCTQGNESGEYDLIYAVELVIPSTAHNEIVGECSDSASSFMLDWLIKTVSKVDDLELIGFERKVFEEYRYGYKVMFKNIAY